MNADRVVVETGGRGQLMGLRTYTPNHRFEVVIREIASDVHRDAWIDVMNFAGLRPRRIHKPDQNIERFCEGCFVLRFVGRESVLTLTPGDRRYFRSRGILQTGSDRTDGRIVWVRNPTGDGQEQSYGRNG